MTIMSKSRNIFRHSWLTMEKYLKMPLFLKPTRLGYSLMFIQVGRTGRQQRYYFPLGITHIHNAKKSTVNPLSKSTTVLYLTSVTNLKHQMLNTITYHWQLRSPLHHTQTVSGILLSCVPLHASSLGDCRQNSIPYLWETADIDVHFTCAFLTILNKHAPFKKCRTRNRYSPWFTPDLTALNQHKNILWRPALASNSSPRYAASQGREPIYTGSQATCPSLPNFSFTQIADVLKELQNLDPYKSAGLDNLDPLFLQLQIKSHFICHIHMVSRC